MGIVDGIDFVSFRSEEDDIVDGFLFSMKLKYESGELIPCLMFFPDKESAFFYFYSNGFADFRLEKEVSSCY